MRVGFKVDNRDKFVYDPHGLLARVEDSLTAIDCLHTLIDNLGNTYEDHQNKASLARKINDEYDSLNDLYVNVPEPGVMIVLKKEDL